MPRRLRVSSPGIAEHIIQRGNNRQVIFGREDDMRAYINWLKEYSLKYKVAIHTWVLMTNHVHLLCTPSDSTGISNMMQSLGRMYVRYFNKTYERSGTLFEGRYRSCLVQSESYLLQLYRYIELNPVRANMVADPAMYSWSGHQCNASSRKSDLCTPHPLYLGLGKNEAERQHHYRSLFSGHTDGKLLQNIRDATNKGLALGSERFLADVHSLTGRLLKEGKRGRPISKSKGSSK